MSAYDYRITLKNEFEARRGRNAFYSLRAFARDLGLSPARLSEILSGKKGMSGQAAEDIARRLDLERKERELFVLSVNELHSRSKAGKATAKSRMKEVISKASEPKPKLLTIVGWSTDAVFKLSQREGFVKDAEAVGRTLGLPVYIVTGAFRFLARLGLLKDVPTGKAYLAHRAEGRRLNVDYEQILEQARKSFLLSKNPDDLFEHEALLLNEANLVRAQALIAQCLADVGKLETRAKDAKLYFLASQLFSLENKKGKNHDRKN